MARILVFDVNETLLDLGALDATFAGLFGDATVRGSWFELVLRNAMALTITGDRSDFVTVAGASLQMEAAARGIELPSGALEDVATALRTLPPHDDVVPGLTRLREAGLRAVALTNSPQTTADAQLGNAGLSYLFDRIMSVEPTGRFKPAREVYEMAARELAVTTADLRMVAAHDWDVAGAMRAGCAGAYVMRAGTALNPLYPEPDVVGPDLFSVAEAIIAAERP
jgi:2-haloacid dehalogenase